MSTLSIQEIHHYCLASTQEIINNLGWGTISVNTLSEDDKTRLREGISHSVLNWPWAMSHYEGNADNDGILDINLKIVGRVVPGALHAVIICKYDYRRNEFAICRQRR